MMDFSLLPNIGTQYFEPLDATGLAELPVAGMNYAALLARRWSATGTPAVSAALNFWPSEDLIGKASGPRDGFEIRSETGEIIAFSGGRGRKLVPDAGSFTILYPWQLLGVLEDVVGGLAADDIAGEVRPGVVIDGHLILGEGSVVLPGVYIEGNVVVGRSCKIGPNCYLRGSTSIGDNCHVGQAVEIKNSLLMHNVGAGHLSYIGDSVIGSGSNLGGGTITANFRHDGGPHKWMTADGLVDTGRRKLGCVMGDDVHTGVHCSIYPGRKLGRGAAVAPGGVVRKDVRGSDIL